MIALIQRVSRASVHVEHALRGEIGAGLLALVAVTPADDNQSAARLLARLLGYRVFDDQDGRMNRCLQDTGGGLLLVPQFTLAANTRKGTRPGFSDAAPPAQAERLFLELVSLASGRWPDLASGVFGARMQVSLVNDGPVTFWLEA